MEEYATSNRLTVDQPTRGADRSRSLADQADSATDEMLLSQLDDGITLLDVEGAAASRSCSRSYSIVCSSTTALPSGSTRTGTRRQHPLRSLPAGDRSTESTLHGDSPPESPGSTSGSVELPAVAARGGWVITIGLEPTHSPTHRPRDRRSGVVGEHVVVDVQIQRLDLRAGGHPRVVLG